MSIISILRAREENRKGNFNEELAIVNKEERRED